MAPSFFTFFKAEEDNIHLRIPIAFGQCIDEPFPEEVYLRDRNNNLWTVEVAKKGDYWFFVNGWNKFVKDNSLQSLDLLAFTYVSKEVFNVKLYGPCATEKNIGGPPGIMRGVETSSGEEADGNDTEESETETESDDDDNYNDENTETENDEHIEVVNANNAGNRHLKRPSRPCYAMELFEAGLAEQPEGPYFVKKILAKRTFSLFIPLPVIKDYSLTLGEDITLVDPEGREYPSSCLTWDDGRRVVSKEWGILCRANKVDKEDHCICEFVTREGDDRQFLNISFVRSNI